MGAMVEDVPIINSNVPPPPPKFAIYRNTIFRRMDLAMKGLTSNDTWHAMRLLDKAWCSDLFLLRTPFFLAWALGHSSFSFRCDFDTCVPSSHEPPSTTQNHTGFSGLLNLRLEKSIIVIIADRGISCGTM
jgi:hypothetical protein